MSNPRDDLRATEHAIRRDAERVKDLEDQKAALDPADPRVSSLSKQVENITADLKNKAAAERELSEESSGT